MGTRRVAGQYVREQAETIAVREIWIGVAAVAALLIGMILGLPAWILILAEVAAIALFLVVSPQVDRDHGRWLRGAEGEEAVGRTLEALTTDGWHVIHDVSFGRGNIDHVVVGQGGAFAIETKSHGGRVSLERLEPKMLSQAYAEKKTLEARLGIEVEPLLVFSRAYLIERPSAKRQGVTVMTARGLPHYFSRRRPTMSAVQARQVYERLSYAAGQVPART
ncbi:MAG: nuclease-related domain-containing protein [Solirubrobacterales bacterium]